MNDDSESPKRGTPSTARNASRKLVPAIASKYSEQIENHVEKYIGKIESVYHELISDLVHLDVLFVPASPQRPYHVLVTSGVSDPPMKVPPGMESFNRGELLIALPPEWPLDQSSLKDVKNYWPIGMLKVVGNIPHAYQSWIGWGHTVPNGNPATPIANTAFTGALIAFASWLPFEFFQLQVSQNEKISFYSLVPLYQEELDFKLKNGAEELTNRLEKFDPYVNLTRMNVAL